MVWLNFQVFPIIFWGKKTKKRRNQNQVSEKKQFLRKLDFIFQVIFIVGALFKFLWFQDLFVYLSIFSASR